MNGETFKIQLIKKMDTSNLKYLKDVPWLALVDNRWIARFERKMDKWLRMLLPIYKEAKRINAHSVNFGMDGDVLKKDYPQHIYEPEGNSHCYSQNGIDYVLLVQNEDDEDPNALAVNSVADRVRLSWRSFFCPNTDKYYEKIGNVLLIPYFDHRINTSPLYSSVIDNISMEFGKLTENPKVKILFQSLGMYSMTL